jgi:site-specific recombinase XerD
MTLKQYYYDLMKFVKYFAKFKPENFDVLEIEKITYQDLFNYLYNTTNSLSAPTRARRIASIKSFYKWLTVKEKVIKENIALELDSLKIEKRSPLFLTMEESKSLISVIDGEFKERDTAILYIFLLCGVRLRELTNINISDIKRKSLKVFGKGRESRTIPLSNTCIEYINKYLEVRLIPKTDKDALFVSKLRNRISPNMVEKLVKQYITKAGLDKKYSVHKLRHTTGTTLYNSSNNDIRAVQEILGHKSILTTEKYVHLDKEKLRNVIESNPLNKK